MRNLLVSVCLISVFVTIFSPISFGDFSYDIDSFTVTSGVNTFVDEFDDGQEPPSGPNGSSTYNVSSLFSSDAESTGALNLNSIDAVADQCETFIDVWLANIITPGINGSIVGKFSFVNGITQKTGFRIEIINTNGVSVMIWKSFSGRIFASFRSEGNEAGVTESDTDITDSLVGITDITLKLDINIVGNVTALLDYGSNGVFEETLPGHATMIGVGNHLVGFGAEIDNSPDCDAIVNPDGSVDIFLKNSCDEPLSIELKFWAEFSDLLIPILNFGSDGSFVLPPAFETTIPLFPPGFIGSLPSDLVLGLRFVDPVTGEQLCVDTELVP